MSRGKIIVEFQDDLCCLFLDNPSARNAVSKSMMTQLVQGVQTIEREKPKVLVISGRDGKGFCAGGDLVDVRKSLLQPFEGQKMSMLMTKQLNRLKELPIFVIGAVEGGAIGGGAEILTVCDFIIAADTAKIGFVHASLGVSPGWGGGRRLVEMVGKRKALQLLTTAKVYSALQASNFGLIDEVVPPGSAYERAYTLGKRICSYSAPAICGAKEVVEGYKDTSKEMEIFLSLWGSKPHLKALSL